ncbi:hypothetical protein ACFY9N_10790 [Microbacterium sp. NPDC008134]|uniref:hypothetical protein n=1 Tax=Microbacterium sp. NPDC008134 TaxID=3364183 RepID=UPI0036E84E2C
MTHTPMSNPRGPESAGVSPVLAVVFATIGFFALTIFGLGGVSVLTDTDIIATPGLGQWPGIGGMAASVLAFALLLWSVVRRPAPSFFSTLVIAVSTALVHLAAVWIAVASVAGSALLATAVAGDLVRGGASAVLLVAAAIGAWAGIALRRTRARHPRWPWERDDDGE